MNWDNIAQWEFNTDASAVEAALFAVVYRYATREDDNPQLKQGASGAFTIVRSLALLRVSASCSALPLRCGDPLSYLDWSMLLDLSVNLLESSFMFIPTALALEALADRGFIGRFPSAARKE
jgi:hypothetical protein